MKAETKNDFLAHTSNELFNFRMGLLLRSGIYIVPLLQVACAFHAYRSGRPYYWIWIILFFPPVGVLAYAVVEILPGTNWSLLIDANLGFLTFFKKRRLARLADLADFSPTVDNRMAYAEELARQGRHEEAVEEIRGCLSGPLKDDPHILLTLARVLDGAERWQEVLETAHRFRPEDYGKMENTLKYLCAVALDNLENLGEAERLFRELLPGWSGEEVRCRLAFLLLARDRQDVEAQKLLEEIMTNSRRGTAHYRAINARWIKLSRWKLKEMAAKK